MSKKSIMLDLNDPRVAAVASVISNKTCKNILELLAEGDLSESEIAAKLRMPINTVEYNLKKLVHSGLVESSRSFWSRRGKKVPTYMVSGKRIIIEPSKFAKGILPAIIGSVFATAGIKFFVDSQISVKTQAGALTALNKVADSSANVGVGSGTEAGSGLYNTLAYAPNSWVWFFIGALFAILIFLVWNWRDTK